MDILNGIVQFLLVTTISFVVLVLLASHLRFQRLTGDPRHEAPDQPHATDELTLHLANLLGRVHRTPRPFCLVLLETTISAAATRAGGPSRQDLVENLARRVIRRTDDVIRRHPEGSALVLHASRDKAERIVSRLMDHVQREGARSHPPLPAGTQVRAGVATYPENGERTQTLLDQASQALAAAREVPAGWALAPAPPDSTTPSEPRRVTGRQEAWLDKLTGVLREDRLFPVLQRYLAGHRRSHRPASLLLLDVDHLDRYNEHYGRAAGDEILRALGDFLQRHVREEDLIGRFGGDGFLIFLSCPLAQALPVGQRLVNQVRRTALTETQHRLHVAVSAGIAGYPDHGAHPADLLEAAQRALNAARERGVSRCTVFEAAMRPSRAPETGPTDRL